MHETDTIPSVTFAVDDVDPASSPLATCKPLEAVQNLIDTQRYAVDESSQGYPSRGRIEACWSYGQDCVAKVSYHPLIAAAHLAFSEHRPLVLSPDVIWVTIAQGFAQHIRLSPETYRDLLVRHQGKRELKVERTDLHHGSPENPWAEVVAEFAALVRQEIGELALRLVCDFSTTGPTERTVSEVALLDIFEPYFSYHVMCICGIPYITLEGTPADWLKLREKLELLRPFGLDWWLDELGPICDQFARAAGGDIDLEHWRRIYKVRAVYGDEIINGWLAKLFPYTKDRETGQFSHRNVLLDPAVEAEIRRREAESPNAYERWWDPDATAMRPFADVPGTSAKVLPRGLSQVPFTLSERSGQRAMEFLAGPIAVSQLRETGGLRPMLGWAVREAPAIEQAMARLAEHKLEPSQGGVTWKTVNALWADYIPSDVVRFYRSLGSAKIHPKGDGALFQILPLAQWHAPGRVQDSSAEYQVKALTGDPERFRFAQVSDGTELLIELSGKSVGGVFVGRRGDRAVAETGQKVARSFTDFLLRALDEPAEPYFRRAGFVPPP
jgi:Domain of unknown function (DUF4419)